MFTEVYFNLYSHIDKLIISDWILMNFVSQEVFHFWSEVNAEWNLETVFRVTEVNEK
jgi:hypothetical protein